MRVRWTSRRLRALSRSGSSYLVPMLGFHRFGSSSFSSAAKRECVGAKEGAGGRNRLPLRFAALRQAAGGEDFRRSRKALLHETLDPGCLSGDVWFLRVLLRMADGSVWGSAGRSLSSHTIE